MEFTVKYDVYWPVCTLGDYNVWYGTDIRFLRGFRCPSFCKNCKNIEPGWFHWKLVFKARWYYLKAFTGCRNTLILKSLEEILCTNNLKSKAVCDTQKDPHQKLWFEVYLSLPFEMTFILQLRGTLSYAALKSREKKKRKIMIPAGTLHV